MADRHGAGGQRHGRAGRIARRHARIEQRRERVGPAGHRDRGKRGGRRPHQLLEADVRDREAKRVSDETLVRAAVHAEEADGRRDRGLVLPRRRPLQLRERAERALVSDLAERHHRVVLQRALEHGHTLDRAEGLGFLVVAERFDRDAAEEVLAAIHERQEGRARLRIEPAVGGDGAGQLGPHELRLLRVECLQQQRRDRLVGVALEVGVGHGPQTIVGVRHRLFHDVARARVVEAREQHERPVTDVPVRVA